MKSTAFSRSKRSIGKIKDILMKALDDLVSVNSIFTVAVFLGLSFASPTGLHSLEVNRHECDPDVKMVKRLIMYEVVSFSSFLLSSLVAKSLKIYLSIFYPDTDTSDSDNKAKASSDNKLFHPGRGFMFGISILASVVGVLFLTISMKYVVEIKIGKLSCGIHETWASVIALCVLVAIALFIYLPFMSIALIYCMIEP
ncbi:hypothetical protein GH714_029155 [Hevea brasiliensis]|uniref:PGG domain-containing protein n=1 Tax=Hevea brasiliensis TaxID=3981 RepID=A0A6A6K7B3_HEVBR|nr:hypothetical protein GH714_029155 [Hevea brasiliensis]